MKIIKTYDKTFGKKDILKEGNKNIEEQIKGLNIQYE